MITTSFEISGDLYFNDECDPVQFCIKLTDIYPGDKVSKAIEEQLTQAAHAVRQVYEKQQLEQSSTDDHQPPLLEV